MSNYNSLERKNPEGVQTAVSAILIAFGLFFISSGTAAILLKLYFGGKIPSGADFLVSGADVEYLRNGLFIGQIGGTLMGMVVLPLLYVIYLKKDLKQDIFIFSRQQVFSFVAIAVAIVFVILPLIGIIGDWNKSISLPESWEGFEKALRTMENEAAQVTKIIVVYNSTGEMLLVLFTIAVLPAIGEELVFRGILQNSLVKAFGNIHVAVFVSGAIFSFIHFQFFGFFPRMLLGIVLGYLYITSGNILVSMLMHFVNNAMVVLAMNLYNQGVLTIDPESSKDLPVMSVYLSIILSSALLYMCWKMYKQRTESEITNV